MCPPVLSAGEDGLSNVSQAASSSSLDCLSQNGNKIKERNYLGLSDCSSVHSSTVPSLAELKKNSLNLATELRLGLPGSQSPERELEYGLLGSDELDEKPFFQLLPAKDSLCSSSQKNVASGNKRGFSDTMNGPSEVENGGYAEGNWICHSAGAGFESPQSVDKGKFPDTSDANLKTSLQDLALTALQERPPATNDHGSTPASKAQVVGWPPVRSFRKNSLATSSKNNDEVDGKPGSVAQFIKVSVDGAPFLRKVDLRTCKSYQQLSAVLEKMFSCFTIGLCRQGSGGATGREMLCESKPKDLHVSEYVLTYEDEDGDWMLVGDVPWEMFIGSCRRLKIMKGSDAIGLAPRAAEKSKNKA